MNKMDELVNQLCPQGVTVRALSEVSEIKRGSSITKTQTKEGEIPVLAGGQRPAYFHDKSNRDGETIVVAGSGAYAGFVTYWNSPVFVSDAFSIKPLDDSLNTKFCFYFLKNLQLELHAMKSGGGVPHVYGKDVGKLRIPVPPIEIQLEIVKILDTFTDLEAELEAEMEARGIQHAYYRAHLLKLNESFAGLTRKITKARIDDLISYEQPTKYLVASKSYDDRYHTPVLTAGQSFLLGFTNEEHGKYSASVESPVIIFDDFTTSYKWVDFEFKVKSSAMKMLTVKPGAPIRLRYFWYALSSVQIDTSEHARYWISKISNIEIPLPPLDVQDEIIRKLDKFVNLETALRSELTARRKQHEHYRKKIFAFNEAELE